MTIDFRPLTLSDIGDAVALWQECDLTRPWNDPVADAKRALSGATSTIIGAFAGTQLVGTAMTGSDGHRGWIYYLGVSRDCRRWGIGRKLIHTCEDWLRQFDSPKVQLMVRPESHEAAKFYKALGYGEDGFRVFYRRFNKDHRQH